MLFSENFIVEETKRLSARFISGNNMAGTIPSSISNLVDLNTL